MQRDSCLVTKMEQYMSLSPGEAGILADLEREEQTVAAGEEIVPIGSALERLYVLKTGWALVRSPMSRGRRQILRIHLPGDIIGLAELGGKDALHSVEMHTKGILCPFPRTRVSDVFERAPRLGALLTALGSQEQLTMREQIFSLSCRTAEDRLIEFLLSLRDRLHMDNLAPTSRFQVPFSQAQIGHIVGLTPVYVNRLMSKLRTEGRIEVDRPYVRILDSEGMMAQVGFRSIYRRVELEWLPSVAA